MYTIFLYLDEFILYFIPDTMKSHKRKWGRYIVALVVLIWIGSAVIWSSVTPPASIFLKKWDTIQSFYQPLWTIDRLHMKWYIMRSGVNTKKIQTWTYVFSGSYTPESYIKAILAWPTQEYIRYTMLEWWSLYDIDADMSDKWLIKKGDLLARAQSSDEIKQLAETYSFLNQSKPLTTLEWFLYPDTYFLSTNGDLITQFFQATLKRFREKIYVQRETNQSTFAGKLQQYWITLSLPGAITLASVIEKEERATSAKPTIAGIFLNRLAQNIQLWADITLCYGLQEPYETCTPSVINKWIYDKWNIYNTRANAWLPPTPISSISDTTFIALMGFVKTSYLFYLHDSQGKIFYAETNAQHEDNKRNYMK